MIKALRIDHRLVHGQVAFTWTHFLAATRIIVIDDTAANDDFQKMALNMSKPAGVKLNVFTVDKALERIEKIESLSDTIFIIFGCTKDASRFICAHPGFKELNVGGITKKDSSKQYSEVVYLNPDEENDLKQIQNTGCKLYMQQLPSTEKQILSL
ncbi:MAG: PTS sugar transporter subunit IIB [Solobacterium sp.]|jgi:PTS system mannose-specific IIB component|nr:PTS sugar transporter subunit IIB [Solobacterium sp.]MCH4222154.1 PTS sugar transporter subunit IIB [Solobacterium sp.]MCH4265632.1 PTS sugar transporter subunit IIB [Solobacterium sp.]